MLKEPSMLRHSRKEHIAAIGRSFDVYYRDKKRTKRMDRLNAQFIPIDGLAFDVGAHVGDRTGSFLRLGARVVSLEPQPHVFRALRLIYNRYQSANLRCEAVGAQAGSIELHINSANPTITTASSDLIAAAQSASQWQGQKWDSSIAVPVNTLDNLIREYGLPDFVKIDVEGHELEVLKGLSQALPCLSFEFTTIQRSIAMECLDRLRELGEFKYNYSLGEEHSLRHASWLNAENIAQELTALPDSANSGDVFAMRC